MTVNMDSEGNFGSDVPSYADNNVSSKAIKLIQS